MLNSRLEELQVLTNLAREIWEDYFKTLAQENEIGFLYVKSVDLEDFSLKYQDFFEIDLSKESIQQYKRDFRIDFYKSDESFKKKRDSKEQNKMRKVKYGEVEEEQKKLS